MLVSLCFRLPVSLGRGDWWRHAPVRSLRTLVYESRCPCTGPMRVVPRIPTGLDLGPAGPGLVAKLLAVEVLQGSAHKRPQSEASVPSGKSDGCCFPTSTILTKLVGSACCFSVFHLVIREASRTSLSCRRSRRLVLPSICKPSLLDSPVGGRSTLSR